MNVSIRVQIQAYETYSVYMNIFDNSIYVLSGSVWE